MSSDDWDFNSSSDDSSNGWDYVPQEKPKKQHTENINSGFQEEAQEVEKIRGPWHWSLTIVSFLLVGGFSFLMAYLTKSIPKREPWLMGLIFAVPMAAMFVASLLLEHRTCKMTPSYLRKTQCIIALAAVMATFTVGVLCDWAYLARFADRQTVFVLDKSGSMAGDRDEEMQIAMERVFSSMNASEEVGLVLFNSEVKVKLPLAPLGGEEHQEQLLKVLKDCSPDDQTDFEAAMKAALELVRNRQSDAPTKILFLTDGVDSDFPAVADDIMRECLALNVTVDGVAFNTNGKLDVMQNLITSTGGKTVEANRIEQLIDVMVELTSSNYDLLRSQETDAKVMTGIMLGLEGIVIGLGLWLMLSVHGQLRAQMIISPVMGVLGLILMKFVGFNAEMEYWWTIEGAAFTLLGVVFMTQNRLLNQQKENGGKQQPQNNQQPKENVTDFGDNFF